ncbi:recombinase family protein [Bradyrhizobium sp. AUGA SZCCT0240]|uniref:recombinase family protein n=1 Tax=Bradyrhizobium sp. AUGA SZCCT0240 TaxID=2807669 RepID=UPI0028A0CD0E|nr:recombinase family protein [Bradyrhizobium sp. AUGA SZCCT0240]
MFLMCGVFAELERDMIRERVNAGLARAKEREFTWGVERSVHSWKLAYASFEQKGWEY